MTTITTKEIYKVVIKPKEIVELLDSNTMVRYEHNHCKIELIVRSLISDSFPCRYQN
jgi:hypothetical protein